MQNSISRRQLFRLAGAGTTAAALSACSDDTGDTVSANASGSSGCVRTPSQDVTSTESDTSVERVDITDGQPGSLLELNFTILDSGNCLPLGSARVDLWHANASGTYSDLSADGTEGETFLRGTQTSNGNGTVQFTTIFPGWIPGRTTHLNLRVTFLDEVRLATQLFFPDDVSSSVYVNHEEYIARGGKDTTNDLDPFGGNLARLRMEVIAANTGHFGTHTIGIDR